MVVLPGLGLGLEWVAQRKKVNFQKPKLGIVKYMADRAHQDGLNATLRIEFGHVPGSVRHFK
jgi:hypothetical protein